jgi:predicted N-acyltransferase
MYKQHLFTAEDADAWRTFLPSSVSVFGSLEYAEIWQELSGNRACLFVEESNQSSIAYPFFMRPIDSLPFSAHTAVRWDIRTPDFTGPIVQGQDASGKLTGFAERFSRSCQTQGIVAEFAHLHPWIACTELLEDAHLQLDREIVYVDLSLSEEQLWRESFTYACRKNIKRAQREHVEVCEAQTADDIREFHRIYVLTMERNQALDSYYFSLDFFLAFLERMPANARFVLAKCKDRVVAATLYLHDDDSVYSYLGGADHCYQQVRPTNAVIYDTILWAKRQGKKRLILGGGYQPNDGIFRFKSSFSPLTAKFYVYKHIHLLEDYERLCKAWVKYYRRELDRNRYLPAYRSTISRT